MLEAILAHCLRLDGDYAHMGNGLLRLLAVCVRKNWRCGARKPAPRSAASAWRSLCRRAARHAVLSSHTDLLMLSPKLMWHHLTRGDERQISRCLTAGLVQRGKRAGAVGQMSSLWIFFFFGSAILLDAFGNVIAFESSNTKPFDANAIAFETPSRSTPFLPSYNWNGQITCWMTVIIFRLDNSGVCRILPPGPEIICSFLNPWSFIMVCKYASKWQVITKL